MNNYSERPDIERLRNDEFKNKIQKLIEKDNLSIQSATDIINEVKIDFDDSMILEPLSHQIDEIFTTLKAPYSVSSTFNSLNQTNYRVLTDGLIVGGGEANTGKTTFMTALALDLLTYNKNMCALIYSLDDGGMMTKRRILSQLIGESLLQEHITTPTSMTPTDKNVLERMYVRDSIRLQDIEMEAQRIKNHSGCSIIFIGIDYLQIIPTASNVGGTREGFNDVVKRLKEVQKRLAKDGCVLFLLSQLNRASKDDTNIYSMSRFRETSEIENQADVALLMFPVNTDPDIEDNREVKIRIVKNKKGMRNKWWKTQLIKGHRFRNFEDFNPKANNSNENISNPYKNIGSTPTNKRNK